VQAQHYRYIRMSCRVQPGEKKISTKKKVSDVGSTTGDKIATTETIGASTSVSTSESTPAAETTVANTMVPISAEPPATTLSVTTESPNYLAMGAIGAVRALEFILS